MIGAILLAAGTSQRFGSDKLRQPLGDGRCIAGAAAQNLRAAIEYCIAVVPAADVELQALFAAHGLHAVHAPVHDIGMGTSLAYGVRALPAVEGFIVALADMPFVQSTTIRAIARALSAGASIAAPRYRGQRGHPVGFDARWRDALQTLSEDVGARAVVEQHAREIVYVDCIDAGVSIDIDTAEDMRHVTESNALRFMS